MKTHNKLFKTSDKEKNLKEVRHIKRNKDKDEGNFLLETIQIKGQCNNIFKVLKEGKKISANLEFYIRENMFQKQRWNKYIFRLQKLKVERIHHQYTLIIQNKGISISMFSIQMLFISFSCLFALVRSASKVLDTEWTLSFS